MENVSRSGMIDKFRHSSEQVSCVHFLIFLFLSLDFLFFFLKVYLYSPRGVGFESLFVSLLIQVVYHSAIIILKMGVIIVCRSGIYIYLFLSRGGQRN